MSILPQPHKSLNKTLTNPPYFNRTDKYAHEIYTPKIHTRQK